MGDLAQDDAELPYHTFLFKDGAKIDITPDRYYVFASAMNSRGDVVGSASDYQGNDVPFVFIDGEYTELSSDEFYSVGIDINFARQVLGGGQTQVGGQSGAFIWQNGVTQFLPLGPFDSLNATAINNAGQVTGEGSVSDDESHPFIFHDGETVDLGAVPGYTSGRALAISESGIVMVSAGNSNNASVFRYKNGEFTDLGSLGGTVTSGSAINFAGHIVGASKLANGNYHAFVNKGTTMTDLGTLGGVTSSASTITNNGQICGDATRADGTHRPFIYGAGASSMLDLYSLVASDDPHKPYVTLTGCVGVNEFGQVIASGRDTRSPRYQSFLVSPIDSTAPIIKANLTGTKGLNGWYTTNVGLSWSVTDAQAPIGRKTGCTIASVTSDTGGSQFSCNAASIGGTTDKTVTIKRDTAKPVATIFRPVNGATYSRGQRLVAGYSCTDTLSGIQTCSGPVANNERINTSVAVTNKKFTVKATDKAGLISTITVTYSIQ